MQNMWLLKQIPIMLNQTYYSFWKTFKMRIIFYQKYKEKIQAQIIEMKWPHLLMAWIKWSFIHVCTYMCIYVCTCVHICTLFSLNNWSLYLIYFSQKYRGGLWDSSVDKGIWICKPDNLSLIPRIHLKFEKIMNSTKLSSDLQMELHHIRHTYPPA